MENLNDNKPTAATTTEHPFTTVAPNQIAPQTGTLNEQNQALSGFSIQSDMLTSAYFNVDSGVLRETLAAYQIKVTDTQHRASFIGGDHLDASGNSTGKQVALNCGNYPLDGRVEKDSTGAVIGPNSIKIGGNSFMETMTYEDFEAALKIIETVFDTEAIDNTKFSDGKLTIGKGLSGDGKLAGADCHFVSLTSAVTQWVKVKAIDLEYDISYDFTADPKPNIGGLKFYIVIDNEYCPRTVIGNGMSNQQLFVWGSMKSANKNDYQFSKHLPVSGSATSTNCAEFDIDFIRDRFAIMHVVGHLNSIYQTATNMTLPLRLISFLGQIKLDSLNRVLRYIALCDIACAEPSSTLDEGKVLNQVFDYIRDASNYIVNGGNKGVSILGWNDKLDAITVQDGDRPTCLNTSTSTTYTEDPDRKVKHIVVTNLPGMKNGRYGSTMSSSNNINGFFGSISIDMSYSDTHTPVDINGMTVHQWNYDNSDNITGNNNPSNWNVNADEDYMALVMANNNNC